MQNTCFICLEDVSNQEIIFEWCGKWKYLQMCSCNFHAHNPCFQKWYLFNGKCPYCKTEIYIWYLYFWQNYGKRFCYYTFHSIMTIWLLYTVYTLFFDINSYNLDYEPIGFY